MREMIQVRKAHPAFGRGEVHLLEPANRAVLAYTRTYDGETLLVVNNLSPESQSVELELATWADAQPIDLFTGERLAAIGTTPYRLELERYGYRWLQMLK
jgi:maltose alpha-D-glucosyltransferase/alpha-amylase